MKIGEWLCIFGITALFAFLAVVGFLGWHV